MLRAHPEVGHVPQRDAEKLKIGALWVRAHGHDAGRLGGGVSVCQGFLLSLCAKAFASAVTLLQDFQRGVVEVVDCRTAVEL